MTAKRFKMTRLRRVGNWLLSKLLLIGLPPGTTHLLATQGRRTGKLHTTPVQLVEDGNDRYLVAPYGRVDWVRNVEANPRVQIRKGRKVENLEAVPLDAVAAAPILKRYLDEAPITRDYFKTPVEAETSAFETEAGAHPVFRLVRPDQGIPASSNSS